MSVLSEPEVLSLESYKIQYVAFILDHKFHTTSNYITFSVQLPGLSHALTIIFNPSAEG